MKNGLYGVSFGTPIGTGSGVIYARDGELHGGDAIIYYKGNYTVDGDKVTATLQTGRFQPGGMSVFGTDQVTINLVGTATGDKAQFQGTSPQAPALKFTASLKLI